MRRTVSSWRSSSSAEAVTVQEFSTTKIRRAHAGGLRQTPLRRQRRFEAAPSACEARHPKRFDVESLQASILSFIRLGPRMREY